MWKYLLAVPLVVAAAYVTYQKGQKMWWLFGPVGAAYVFWITAGVDDRRRKQAEQWRAAAGGPRRVGEVAGPASKRRKKAAGPGPDLLRLVEEAGGGIDVGTYELHPGLAYVTFRAADSATLSDYTAVLLRLEESQPRFSVRPLPIIEGKRVANVGILFKKDRAFTEAYLVEGVEAAKIRRFLTADLREELLALPDLWVRVEGTALSIGLYGSPSASTVEKLVDIADAIFAEHGAGGGPALVAGDDEAPKAPPPPPKKKKVAPKKAQPSAP